MNTIVFDGANMTTIQSAHSEIASKMNLPAYYGKNLDALFDVLSSFHEETQLGLINGDVMLNALEGYGASMLKVFYDACSENGHIEFSVLSVEK